MLPRRGWGTLALILLATVYLILAAVAAPVAPRAASSAPSTVRASATVVAPRATYFDSAYLDVNWTVSTDTCFGSYAFNFGATKGNFTTVANLTTVNTTDAAVSGLVAGRTYYYQIVDTDCNGTFAMTPTYTFTAPLAGPLTYTVLNETAVRLQWQDTFSYGGGRLNFSGYDLYDSFNGSAPNLVANFSKIGNVSYTFAVPQGGKYSFQLVTMDACLQCSSTAVASPSNNVTFTAATPVSAVATASSVMGEVGLPSSFSCVGQRGVAPYTYAWTFSDGTTAGTAYVTHSASGPGTLVAICTVRDAASGIATGLVTVNVFPGLIVNATSAVSQAAPGSAITFNVSVSGGSGGPYTITWNFGDGSSGTGVVAGHTYANAGTYLATVTATDKLGGTVTQMLPVITIAGASSGNTNSPASAGTPSGGADLGTVAGVGFVVVLGAAASAYLVTRGRKDGFLKPKKTSKEPPEEDDSPFKH